MTMKASLAANDLYTRLWEILELKDLRRCPRVKAFIELANRFRSNLAMLF